MKKTKRVATIVLVVLVVLSIAGCQMSNWTFTKEKNEKKTAVLKKLENPDVTVLTWGDPEQDAEQDQTFIEVCGGNITYVLSTFGQTPNKLATMVVAGDSPDAVIVSSEHMPNYAIKNLLQPIDLHIDLQDPMFDFYIIDQLKYKNQYYVVCNSSGCRLLFFNKTMFENNGIKTPWEYYKEGNWNWNVLRDLSKTFTVDTNGDGVIDQGGISYNETEKQIFIMMNGGDFVEFTEDGIKLTLRENRIYEALQFVQDIHAKDNAVMKLNDFVNGKVAMAIMNRNAALPGNKLDGFKYEWGIAPFPAGPSASVGIGYGGAGGAWGIPSGAKNPEGGAAFIYARMDYARQTKDDKYAEVYNDEQLKLISSLESKVTIVKHKGVANMTKVFNSLWSDIIKKDLPIATAIEKYEPLFQAEIDVALQGSK